MISFLTLFARDVERTARLYRLLGLDFVEERHGVGPPHLACITEQLVIEIYPGEDTQSPGMLIGFCVPNLNEFRADIVRAGFAILKDADVTAQRLIVADPEGRKLLVSAAREFETR